MRKRIRGSIFAVIALMIAVMVSIGIVVAGEENQGQPATGDMKVSAQLLDVLKKLEGFNPHAYWDYQQYSIGYGSKCPEGYENYYLPVSEGGLGNQISEEYALELLAGELVYFETVVNNFIKRNNLTLAQHQYDALISFTYNTGYGWSSTTGNLVTAIFNGDKGSHFIYGMMLWSMAGDPERHILVNRRIVETNMYANGVYPENPVDASQAPARYRIAFMDGNGGVVSYNEHGFDAEQPIAIKTTFKSKPVGPDETGVLVTYEFDGWYTEREGGTKVEILDSSIVTGKVLYAHWKTPAGTPVTIPRQNTGIKLNVTLTGHNVNIRSGPETYYEALYQAPRGEVMEIDLVVKRGSMYWGRSGDKWVALMYTDYETAKDKMLPMWGKVTGTTLNVRKDAGTGSAIVEGAGKKKDDLILITDWKTDETVMWGKIEEGWVSLEYVTFDGVKSPDQTVQTIEVSKAPNKLSYVHKSETLDITGGKLLVTYADNSTSLVDITEEMVSGFDNTAVGTNVVTVTYEGKTATFEVQIVKAKVVFKLDDGTIISENEYLVGDTVVIPETPTKPTDSNGYYVFIGWGREVTTTCDGNAEYIAVFEQRKITGDCNSDGKVTDKDAIYLLRHVYFPNRYPIDEPADYNKDGKITDKDAIYLLRHVYFPNRYPLS